METPRTHAVHFSSKTDLWATPTDLFSTLDAEFGDWYVEMSKGRLRKDEVGRMKAETAETGHPSSFLLHSSESRASVQRVLVGVLDAILRLVHPIMPFVAETIWQALAGAVFERGLPVPEPAAESVVIAPWPSYPASWRDPAMETRIARMQELVSVVREVRNRHTLDKAALDVFVRCADTVADDFRALQPFIASLAGVGKLECGPAIAKPKQAETHVRPEFEAYVSLAGLIDVAAEIKRLEKQIAELTKHLQATRAKLENKSFVDKAPAEVVQQQRDLVAELEGQIKTMQASLLELKEG